MKSVIKLFVILLVASSCGGGKDNPPTQPQPEVKELGAFNLVFPDNNLICTEGEDTGNNEVSLDFLWTVSANATSYTLEIVNQDSGAKIVESATAAEKTVVLPKDVQFTWNVTAMVADKTKKSDQWNFYSEGIAQENYTPFPAEITVSDNGNGSVEISWQGADLDNDIALYEIYFGTTEEPAIVHTATNDSESLTQSIAYGTDHYLKIVTIDELGNMSIAKTTVNF